MAIAVGHFHDVDPGSPDVRGRHCRLHSVAQLDSPLLDRDYREHSDAAAGAS
jgi:hypothetical protein